MTAFTEILFPLNPFKYEVPEDVSASSKRVMNFWVGAMSPMWMPFMAATSLGVGAWMMGRGMSEAMAKTGVSFEGMTESPTLKGLMRVEKAFDEGVAAPLHAFVEAEAAIADQVLGDYSPSKEAIAEAYRAEAEAEAAAIKPTVVAPEIVEPLPIAQKLAVAPSKSRSKSRRR